MDVVFIARFSLGIAFRSSRGLVIARDTARLREGRTILGFEIGGWRTGRGRTVGTLRGTGTTPVFRKQDVTSKISEIKYFIEDSSVI